jgi:hypothetical protein
MQTFRSTAIFGALGIISGFLTPNLSDAFRALLPDPNILDMPLSLWLAGIAFGAALGGGLAWVLGFERRQFLIVLFVLAGWFCAVQVTIRSGAGEPKSYASLSSDAEPVKICTQPDGSGERGNGSATEECFQIYPASVDQETPAGKYWRSLAAYFAAGLVGALITAFGIPITTRRPLAWPSYAAIALTGGVAAVAWFVVAGAVPALRADDHWYGLFVSWQAAVAIAVERSLKGASEALRPVTLPSA